MVAYAIVTVYFAKVAGSHHVYIVDKVWEFSKGSWFLHPETGPDYQYHKNTSGVVSLLLPHNAMST